MSTKYFRRAQMRNDTVFELIIMEALIEMAMVIIDEDDSVPNSAERKATARRILAKDGLEIQMMHNLKARAIRLDQQFVDPAFASVPAGPQGYPEPKSMQIPTATIDQGLVGAWDDAMFDVWPEVSQVVAIEPEEPEGVVDLGFTGS